MEIKAYLQTLWKWWWLIVVCTLCAGVSSFIVTSLLPPTYEARVLLMSNQSANTGIVDYSSLLGEQRVIATYQELLETRPILDTVITNLSLPYTSKELAKRITVSLIPETQLLELTVQDSDAQRAADIANEIAFTFLLQRSSEQEYQDLELYEQSLMTQIKALEQTIENTKADLERARATSGLWTQQELTSLQTNLTQQQATYASLLSGYLNLQSMKSRLLDVVIAEPAYAPSEAIGPRRLLYTGIAGASGFVIACVIAFLLEYMRDRFENATEVHDALALASLGAIPFVQSWHGSRHIHTPEEQWPPVAEAFRILRMNIKFAGTGSKLHTLLVTSPVANEGKTSIVANLGVMMAQAGSKVLLVDGDLRHSSLHQAFEVSNHEGLTSLLLMEANPEEYILDTGIPNLSILPSGPMPPNPSELLGSARMGELVKELQTFADVVLFDAPPILVCADTIVLAPHIDGLLLVLDSRKTQRDRAVRALAMLKAVEAKIVGSVLNKVQGESSEYYHYHSRSK
jgi:capsular exopolysaccharide synthesis family protein